jgi:DNA adenine methylase
LRVWMFRTWKTASFCFLRNLCMRRRLRKGGDSINSFMAWVGGKKALRDEILARFPRNYKRYIEVFGGAGWVLFHKPPGNDFEVFNDFNGNLVNLYRCVREQPEALRNELRYMLNSRLDFEYMKGMLHSQAVLPDVRRAAYYYALIRYSYAAGTSTFGSQPHAMWNNFPLIESAAGRLQKVVIENKDCVKLIRQYDRPESFFYCDPPYYNADQYYEAVSSDGFDHAGLADALLGIKGKFLLSYNDCPEIRALYDHPGIVVEGISRLSNIAQRYENGKQYPELLISNYDTTELARSCVQLTLFDRLDSQEILNERILYHEI